MRDGEFMDPLTRADPCGLVEFGPAIRPTRVRCTFGDPFRAHEATRTEVCRKRVKETRGSPQTYTIPHCRPAILAVGLPLCGLADGGRPWRYLRGRRYL